MPQIITPTGNVIDVTLDYDANGNVQIPPGGFPSQEAYQAYILASAPNPNQLPGLIALGYRPVGVAVQPPDPTLVRMMNAPPPAPVKVGQPVQVLPSQGGALVVGPPITAAQTGGTAGAATPTATPVAADGGIPSWLLIGLGLWFISGR